IPVPGSVRSGRISTISQLSPVRLSATPSDIPHIPAPTISTFSTECIRYAAAVGTDLWKAQSALMFASRITRPNSLYCLLKRAAKSAPHMQSGIEALGDQLRLDF